MADRADTKQVHLTVLTPRRVVYDRTVDFVITRATEGDIGIMYGHEPCSALLDYGALRIFVNKQEEDVLTVLGGIVTVLDNEIIIMSDMAERPDKLQEAIEQLREEREANKLMEQTAELDMHRAEMAIRRALVHMDVSPYSILKDNEEKT